MTRKRGYGTIRRLSSGRYQARTWGTDGKQHTAPHTFATKQEADRWLAHHRTAIDKGDWIDNRGGRVKLDVYGPRWIDTRKVKGQPLRPRTADLYRQLFRSHISPTLGRYELRAITPALVRKWFGSLEGGVVPAKAYRLLHAMLASAVHDELIGRNPCTIRGAGQEHPPDRPMFSLEQVERIAISVDGRWRALVLMAAWTSLRLGELSELRRKDLDLDAGFVTVTKSKTDAGRRIVAIPPHIIDALREHVAAYSETGPNGLVFIGPKGAPIRRNNFSTRVWVPAATAAGLPAGSRFHDLRGFGLTLAARHGATTRELMHRAGHASPAMALRYQRAEHQRDRALAEQLSRTVLGTTP